MTTSKAQSEVTRIYPDARAECYATLIPPKWKIIAGIVLQLSTFQDTPDEAWEDAMSRLPVALNQRVNNEQVLGERVSGRA